MKARLSGIVKGYGFKNAESFYKVLHKAESANEDYQNRSKKWEQQYGQKPQSLRERLRTMEQEVGERPAEKRYRQSKDRGAR